MTVKERLKKGLEVIEKNNDDVTKNGDAESILNAGIKNDKV